MRFINILKNNKNRREALAYHAKPKPGKIEVIPTTKYNSQRDLSLAYSPGVAHACELIVENPTEVASVTSRGNLVAVITNGTAVLGLGNIGPLASKPVMEGKAVLFKRFADVDSMDLCVDTEDPDAFINAVNILRVRAKARDWCALMQHKMPPIRQPGRGVIAQGAA